MNLIAFPKMLSIITALTLVSAAASATVLPSDVPDLNDVADRYVQSKIRCTDGQASVATRTRISGIEQISFEVVQARPEPNSKLFPITCGDRGFLLNGKKLTTPEVATYAMANHSPAADRGEWVLILTPTNQPATFLPGFNSEVACEQAVNIWQGRGRAENDRPGHAVCIQRK